MHNKIIQPLKRFVNTAAIKKRGNGAKIAALPRSFIQLPKLKILVEKLFCFSLGHKTY